jgi:hypothetical protein
LAAPEPGFSAACAYLVCGALFAACDLSADVPHGRRRSHPGGELDYQYCCGNAAFDATDVFCASWDRDHGYLPGDGFRQRGGINSLIRQVSLRADYDFLTHVYSRSGFMKRLSEEAHRHPRYLTVMLLDIDYFKSINDNYGHECGTACWRFAQKVQRVGEEGMVARMGGEEFAVVNSGDARNGLNWPNVSEFR